MVAVTTIVTLVFVGLTLFQIGQEYVDAKQQHEDLGETVDSLELLSESLNNFVDSLVSALDDFAAAIMQYMDIWGVVILSCVAVVGIISFFNLYLLARGNRR